MAKFDWRIDSANYLSGDGDKIRTKDFLQIIAASLNEYRKYEIFDGRYKEFKGEGHNLDKRHDSPRRSGPRDQSTFGRRKSYGHRDERPERSERFERGERGERPERPFRPARPQGKPFEHRDRDRFKPEGERPKRLHGDEAFQKFVTFKRPSIKPNDEDTKPRTDETDTSK